MVAIRLASLQVVKNNTADNRHYYDAEDLVRLSVIIFIKILAHEKKQV